MVTYCQCTMAQNTYYHFKREKRRHIVRKYWTKARPRPTGKILNLAISVSNLKVLFISSSSISFVDYNTLLSLGLDPFPVKNVPWQVSHGSGIFNILMSPRQLQFHSFLFQCLGSIRDLLASPKGLESPFQHCPL